MKIEYLKDVTTLTYLADKCVGCGRCIEVCPHEVFELNDGRARLVNKNACMECGACSNNCAFDAISVRQGVGCAYAVIIGWIKGSDPDCDCGNTPKDCC